MVWPLTSGAWTTASTLAPPTAHPASVTATATLAMRAAHVSEQMSYVCGLAYTLFSLVTDDPTAKAKPSEVLKKIINTQINSLKTETSFKSKSML